MQINGKKDRNVDDIAALDGRWQLSCYHDEFLFFKIQNKKNTRIL